MSGAVFRGSPDLQRTGWADCAKVADAWQAPCSEAVWSSRGPAGLIVREWLLHGRRHVRRQTRAPEDRLRWWCERGSGVFRGSLELQRTGWADGVRLDFAWQAPCSEAVLSSRGQAGLAVRDWPLSVGRRVRRQSGAPEDRLGWWCESCCRVAGAVFRGSPELQRTGLG